MSEKVLLVVMDGIGFSKTMEDDIEDKATIYEMLSKFSNQISLELK